MLRSEPIAVGEGAVAVDGALDEPAWSVAPAKLLPLSGGVAPPPTTLRVVAAPDGLALGVSGLPDGFASAWMVDPDGLSQAWVKLESGPDGVTAKRCTLGLEERTAEWGIPPKAVPCVEAVPITARRVGGEIEVLVPWSSLPTASIRMRLAWAITGPKGRGGTLAGNGSADALPTTACRLLLPGPAAKLVVASDVDHDRWTASLDVLRQAGPAVWDWTRQVSGRELDRGEVATTGPGTYAWAMSDLDRQGVVVEVRRRGAGPVAVALAEVVRRRRYELHLATPVFDGQLELSYEVPDPTDWRVTVTGERGPVGEAAVVVPPGLGRLVVRADPAWGRVRVVVTEPDGDAVLDAGAWPAP